MLAQLPAGERAGTTSDTSQSGQLAASASPRLAQATPPPGTIPTDITPIDLGEAREFAAPAWRFRLMQKLPKRMWLNSSTEVTQRLDTNVFFTAHKKKADYTFRTLPNVTLGYNLLTRTSIYCNYFVIKDVYAQHGNVLTFPTTQSVSMGLRQDLEINPKTFVQLDFQARELWQTTNLHQADLLPAINVTRLLSPRAAVFGSLILQMRGRELFQGPTREIDPFYSIGFLYRKGLWTFIATNTFVSNFRNKHAVPPQTNLSMITDIELARPVAKRLPVLQFFVRAEPIWNWASNDFPGISGFNFRLFSGFRLSLNKPSYAASVEKLRKQILESEEGTQKPGTAAPPAQKGP